MDTVFYKCRGLLLLSLVTFLLNMPLGLILPVHASVLPKLLLTGLHRPEMPHMVNSREAGRML